MKKLLALLLAGACFLSLTACQPATQPETDPDAGSDTPSQTETLPTVDTPSFTAETLPRIDGSTATIPLSEGIVKTLLSYSPEQAQEFVKHNTTHYAYENLIDGKCDVIFVTPPSDEELQLMKDAGEEFEVVRVVKDAFVFLVNQENPVESLTLAQIQDIYRGKITNWSEVGGEDLEIIPYQREDNSGSQTLMYKLVLPKGEITQAPTELRIEGMDGLVDAVSSYDGTGKASLGYSVYYYASGMYTNENSRLLKVDGVEPTNDTIASDEYPLVDGYYAVFRKSEAEDSAVRQLVTWLTSLEGQTVAASEGYVPLQPLK